MPGRPPVVLGGGGSSTCIQGFTHAFLIDPERIEDMPAKNLVEQELNVTQYQRLLRVGTRQPESDLISMITGEAWDLDESDFVVLKFDCDLDVHKSSLEWGFLADLVYAPEALRLVDEIFIEMHFFYPSLWQDKSNLTPCGSISTLSASFAHRALLFMPGLDYVTRINIKVFSQTIVSKCLR